MKSGRFVDAPRLATPIAVKLQASARQALNAPAAARAEAPQRLQGQHQVDRGRRLRERHEQHDPQPEADAVRERERVRREERHPGFAGRVSPREPAAPPQRGGSDKADRRFSGDAGERHEDDPEPDRNPGARSALARAGLFRTPDAARQAMTSARKMPMTGTLTAKAARHETVSVTKPAISGPPNAAAAQTTASAPKTFGMSCAGKSSGMRA